MCVKLHFARTTLQGRVGYVIIVVLTFANDVAETFGFIITVIVNLVAKLFLLLKYVRNVLYMKRVSKYPLYHSLTH